VMDTPAPQVREHSLHGPHSLQPPWIASGLSPIVTHCWFRHHCKSNQHWTAVQYLSKAATTKIIRYLKYFTHCLFVCLFTWTNRNTWSIMQQMLVF
jgi:hypothetical protein